MEPYNYFNAITITNIEQIFSQGAKKIGLGPFLPYFTSLLKPSLMLSSMHALSLALEGAIFI